MITFLVYLAKREELKKQISSNKVSGTDKVPSLQSLLKLRELEANNKEVMLETENIKKSLKNKFWLVWDRVALEMGRHELIA